MKQKLGRVFKLGRSRGDAGGVPVGDLRPVVAADLDAFTRANPAIFERAQRLRERAERTGSDGVPSESASLRAARAREEALGALAGVRAALVDAHGTGGGEAFDLEFEVRYPMTVAGSGTGSRQDVIEP